MEKIKKFCSFTERDVCVLCEASGEKTQNEPVIEIRHCQDQDEACAARNCFYYKGSNKSPGLPIKPF